MKFILIEQYDKKIIDKEVLNLINSQMEFINSKQNTKEIESFLKTYLTASSNAKLLLLYDDSLVGFSFFNISIGLESKVLYIWINELHISSDYHNKSYGTKIIKYIEGYAKANNILKIMGLVSNENSATTFYKKNDFLLDKYSLFNKDIKKEKLSN